MSEGTNLKDLSRVLKKVHKYFRYTEDKEEVWACHADTVEAGEKFYDDCDGFALTCAELLLRAGVPNVSLVICTLPEGGGHLVCVVDKAWVLDNNFHYVYHWKDSNYKWKFILDTGGKWRSVSNSR